MKRCKQTLLFAIKLVTFSSFMQKPTEKSLKVKPYLSLRTSDPLGESLGTIKTWKSQEDVVMGKIPSEQDPCSNL